MQPLNLLPEYPSLEPQTQDMLCVSADTRSHYRVINTKDIFGSEHIAMPKVKVKCTFQSELHHLSMQ
jgi:hypothetical protein